jgi:transposase
VAGRPTKLTPEVETDLVLLLANGLSIRSAARVVGVSRRSLTRWLADGMAERVLLGNSLGVGRLSPALEEPAEHAPSVRAIVVP